MMNDLDVLLEGFESGRFARADAAKLNPVSLARAVSEFGGYSPWAEPCSDPVVTETTRRIGDPDHLVVVVADGFGMNFVDRLPADSFSRRKLAWSHPAVFPTSTGPNVSALYGGEWPAQHGFVGWWVYLPKLGERVTPYGFVRTSDGADLSGLGIRPADVFFTGPFTSRLDVECRLYHPELFSDSVATLNTQGEKTRIHAYRTFDQAAEMIQSDLRRAGRTISMFYWGELDVAAHSYGTDSKEVTSRLVELDSGLAALADALAGRARMVVTADHGHLDVTETLHLDRSHTLAGLMRCTQSGEPRSPYFHVRPGEGERFREGFREDFGEHFLLLERDEFLDLGMLGPVPPAERVKERVGDLVALNTGGAIISSSPATAERGEHLLKSTHGGITTAETMVPVILA